jgi:ketosteroid isomerase-like protein
MSQENVEVVRASLEAWKTGDVDALVELCHPGVIAMGPGNWADGDRPTIGQRAVGEFFGYFGGTGDADTAQVTGLADAGDHVVARLLGRPWGGRSEPWVLTCVFTLEEDRISLIQLFDDHAQALEAVGLSEQDAHSDS